MLKIMFCMALLLCNQTNCMWQQTDTTSHNISSIHAAQAEANWLTMAEMPADIKNEILISIAAAMPTHDAMQAIQTLTAVSSQWQRTIQNSDRLLVATLAARLKLPLFLTAAYLKNTPINFHAAQNHELCKAVQDARFLAHHLKSHKAHTILALLENRYDQIKAQSSNIIHFLKSTTDNSEIAWIYANNSYLVNRSYLHGLTKTLHLLKFNDNSICDTEFVQDYIASPQAIDGSNIEHDNTFLGVHIRRLSFECGKEKPQLALQDNGKIIVLFWHGLVKKQFYLVRLTEKGSVDYSFGQKGIARQKSNSQTIDARTDFIVAPQLLIDPQTNQIVVTYDTVTHSFSCDGKEIS